MKVRQVGVALVMVGALAACGGGGAASSGSGSSTASSAAPASSTTSTTTAASPTSAAPETAAEVSARVKAAVPSVVKVVQIDENNDPNNKIGRPGGYTSAAVFYDKGTSCTALGSDCGAMVEVWPTAADAKNRSDFIQAALKAANGVLGTEYDYLKGPVLLRVSGMIKPTEAKLYQGALG